MGFHVEETMVSIPLALALSWFAAIPVQKPAAQDARPILEAAFAAPRFQSDLNLLDARLRELEAISLDAPPVEKEWTKRIADLCTKGRKLEKKSGTYYWREKEKRGLFILSGETRNPKGLLLAMHGGGEGSGDATTAQSAFSSAASKFDWLMICPEVLEKTERGWTDSGTEEFVLQLVEAALRTWKIDRDRVYFSGHSMGGYGTWLLGAHHADRVAALAPSAGAPTPILDPSGAALDIVSGVVPNLRNVPMVIYQSDDDPRVPPEANRIAVQKLAEARKRWGGYEHEYWEVPNRQHEVPPGGMVDLLAKVRERVRDTRPVKIVWQPTLPWKRQFYWLWWDAPKANALVVAEVDRAQNAIVVTADCDPKGLEVLLDERLLDVKKEVVVRFGDKEVFRGFPRADLGTLTKTSLSGDSNLAFTMRVKLAP